MPVFRGIRKPKLAPRARSPDNLQMEDRAAAQRAAVSVLKTLTDK